MEVIIGKHKIPNKYICEELIRHNLKVLETSNISIENIDIYNILGQGYCIDFKLCKDDANAYYKGVLEKDGEEIVEFFRRTVHKKHKQGQKCQSIYCYSGLFVRNNHIALKVIQYNRIYGVTFGNTISESEAIIPIELSIRG